MCRSVMGGVAGFEENNGDSEGVVLGRRKLHHGVEHDEATLLAVMAWAEEP